MRKLVIVNLVCVLLSAGLITAIPAVETLATEYYHSTIATEPAASGPVLPDPPEPHEESVTESV